MENLIRSSGIGTGRNSWNSVGGLDGEGLNSERQCLVDRGFMLRSMDACPALSLD